jgi:aminoglycoside phosphotransferase (APT) family kinase protein
MAEMASTVGRLAALLGQSDGEPEPLDGGITNRNYRAAFGGRDYVIRLPCRDGEVLSIDRTAERMANQRAAELGLAPGIAATLEDPPLAVLEFVHGQPMTAGALRDGAMVAAVAVALRRLHGSGLRMSHAFDSFQLVEDYARRSRARGGVVPGGYDDALACGRRVAAALTHAEHAPVPCHNDLLPANFIRGADRLWILDWEYAGMGDRYFDLANFAAGCNLDDDGMVMLLEAYFGEPPQARRRASLQLMRFMSDFREGMWGVVQGVASDLEFDFAGYASEHFERLAARAGDDRFAGWLRDARG